MLEGSLFGTLLATKVATATFLDHVDIWVNAAQAIILALLAFLATRTSRQGKRNEDKIDSVHTSVTHAATAAAAAASAAQDSARITRDIGGALRSVHVDATQVDPAAVPDTGGHA